MNLAMAWTTCEGLGQSLVFGGVEVLGIFGLRVSGRWSLFWWVKKNVSRFLELISGREGLSKGFDLCLTRVDE